MSVRQHPTKGAGWWYIDIGYGKNRKNYPFQGTRAEAERLEAQIRKHARPGPPDPNPRIDEIAADYLADYLTHHQRAGADRQRRCLAQIRQKLGRYNLLSITPPIVERYKRQRLDENVKPTTIQKELSGLSGLLAWAVERGMIATAPKIKRFPAGLIRAPIPQVPTAVEVHAILAKMPHHKRPIFALMYWCGLRSSEARHLRAENVVSGRRMLIIKGKGGRQRTVPVPDDELWTQIEIRVKESPTGWLWPNPETKEPYVDLRGTLKAAATAAGYRGNLTPHKFRHAYGTELITTGGATLRDVQVLLGHSTSQVTEIYTHLSTNRLTTVTNGLKKHLQDMQIFSKVKTEKTE